MFDPLWPTACQTSMSLHYLPEFAQTRAHGVGDAIQPSHPLVPPSSLALNISQHQGLFQWVSSLHQVVKVLKLQHQSFQWIVRVDFLQDWLVWSPSCPRDSKELLQHHNWKASILQCSNFFMVQLSHLYMTRSLSNLKGRFFKYFLPKPSIYCCYLVAKLWPTLCDPMDCCPTGSSVQGDFPGKNTGLGCHFLLQGIFWTQRSNPGLLPGRQILYHWTTLETWKRSSQSPPPLS